MTDGEIFRGNVLRYKPKGMGIGELEKQAGYTQSHLWGLNYWNSNITVDHARNYARVLGVPPLALLEGMFDEN